MGGAPQPEGEARRLRGLHRLDVLDTSPEEALDRLTRLASMLLKTPIALVSLVDEDRQWFKSRVGLDARETPREHAFCAWALHDLDIMEVSDAADDPRFADNPLVRGDPRIRFYAGAPLATADGVMGTLCVIDRVPRTLSERQRRILSELAATTVETLETRRLARVLRERNALLTIAEELAGVGHWRVDLRRDSLFWSEQVYAIRGLDPDTHAPTRDTAVDMYHPDDRATVSRHLERAIAERAGFHFEARLVRADGEIRLVESIGRTEVDEETDEAVAMFGVFRDITDARKLQQRLAQAEKMASVGTLAAGVAHEINNPLSYVMGNAFTLAEEIAQWSGASPSARLHDLAEIVEEIREGTQRIKKIVGGLKTFARNTELRVETVELGRVLSMSSRLCMNELRHKARFELEVADDTPLVQADESQLVQVAVNLIVNACQAIEEGGTSRIEEGATSGTVVTARAGRDGDNAFFEVEDSGGGMAPEVLREAFTPFFTTKPRAVGTGLGLAICHGIVTSFGGHIDAASTEGVGTRIRVTLPASVAEWVPPRKPLPRPSQVPDAPRGRVLIVDDEAPVARALARLLHYHAVDTLTDPRVALQRIRAGERWDAILCDLMMPSMSGPAFHAALDADFPELAKRMIMVTGGAFTREGREFLASVPIRVVDKPVDAGVLRTAISEVLLETER